MKKYVYILLMAVGALATSCVSQHKVNTAYDPFKPGLIRLSVEMDDYNYLGDVTMEVVYTDYGLWKKIHTINGQKYDPRFYTTTNLDLLEKVKMSKWMKRACYKIVDEFPNPDYIVPVFYKQTYEHMIGGRMVKETMRVKVFELKTTATTSAEEQAAAIEQVKAEMQGQQDQLSQENAQLREQLQSTQQELELQKSMNKSNQRRR